MLAVIKGLNNANNMIALLCVKHSGPASNTSTTAKWSAMEVYAKKSTDIYSCLLHRLSYKVSCNLSYGTQRKTRAVLVVFAVLAMLGDYGESFDKQLDNNIIVSDQADATKMRYWE